MTPYDWPSQKGMSPLVSTMMWQVSPVALGPTILSTDLILALKGFLGLNVFRGRSPSSSSLGMVALSSTVMGTWADVLAAWATVLRATREHRLLTAAVGNVCNQISPLVKFYMSCGEFRGKACLMLGATGACFLSTAIETHGCTRGSQITFLDVLFNTGAGPPESNTCSGLPVNNLVPRDRSVQTSRQMNAVVNVPEEPFLVLCVLHYAVCLHAEREGQISVTRSGSNERHVTAWLTQVWNTSANETAR